VKELRRDVLAGRLTPNLGDATPLTLRATGAGSRAGGDSVHHTLYIKSRQAQI